MPIVRKRVMYLTPDDDAHAALMDAAKSSTKSLHVLIYGFTLADLGDLLIEKMKAGLTVGVVSDKTQAAGPKQHALLQRLVDAGVPVTITTSDKHQINHEKVMLVDIELGTEHNDSVAVYGSYNFSDSAERQNNHLQVDNDPSICAYFWSQYQSAEAFGKQHFTQLSPN